MPEVSVIVATHNNEQTISKAIISAQNQTVVDIEIIVVDDASTDRTSDLAVALATGDSRIKFLHLGQNIGAAGARNVALANATGEWITVLDGDDWYDPCRLEVLLEAAHAHHADLVADNLKIYDHVRPHNCFTTCYSKRNEVLPLTSKFFFDGDNPFRWHKMGYIQPLIRTSFLLDHKIIYNQSYLVGEDFLFVSEILLNGARGVIIPGAFYNYMASISPSTMKISPSSHSHVPELLISILRGCDELLQKYGATMGSEAHRALVRRRWFFEHAALLREVRVALRHWQFVGFADVMIRHPVLLLLIFQNILELSLANTRTFYYWLTTRRVETPQHQVALGSNFSMVRSPSVAGPLGVDIWHNILWARYKGEVFSSLYKIVDKNELAIHFFQIAETNSDRVRLSTTKLDHHRYPFDLLFKMSYDKVSFFRRLTAILARTILSDAKLTILAGYASFEFWVQFLVLSLKRQKIAVFCDSTIYDHEQRLMFGFLKRFFFQRMDGIFAYGLRSKEYVVHYGACPDRVYDQCQAAALPSGYTAEKALAMRLTAAPLPDAPRYLYVGRLSTEKGLDTLLDAFARVCGQIKGASLVLIGSGSLRAKLEKSARALRLGPAVHFAGSKSGDELFTEYAKATILLLPSTSEPWGLVVNEALSCGCPVIVSDRCGCVPELLIEGKTGFVHRASDANDLAAKMLKAPSEFADIEKTARDCLTLMSNYTPNNAAEHLLEGIRDIMSMEKKDGRERARSTVGFDARR
jgi:glycosyltransferase involved in cell wall biosynthesis/GT2 family glycosyltransferase